MSCAHERITDALDRWQESHWHLHQVENEYHHADAFRYSVNSFIRSIREVPDLINMALQKHSGFKAWHSPIKKVLEQEDPLFSKIISHRNHIVHRSMLVPGSKAHIAAIRGFTIKMALPYKVDPFEDSDHAVERFIARARKAPSVIGFLAPDETQVLSVIREWKIDGIEEEVICAFRKAFFRVREYLSDVVEFLGGERFSSQPLKCFKDPRIYQYKKYPQLLNEVMSIAEQSDPPNPHSSSAQGADGR